MSNLAIEVENLSKAYRIGLAEKKHETLASALYASLASPFHNFRRLRGLGKLDNLDDAIMPEGTFWALKDVSFQLSHGEVLGVVGRNGAGKSTLLKILSRITEPTRGHARIYGRVASLLEVGTGFHPDLTGRENVYLNGTILGMSRREVERKFDEIVAFSEVERFIDTPVKRYSSGMKMRLAFSVAAHLEAEILIIDEVLAVGDMKFQRKCLNSMESIARGGRTVLFVSHNLGAVKDLCSKAIVLESGRLAFLGDVLNALNYYASSGFERSTDICAGSKRSEWSGLGVVVRANNVSPDLINCEPFQVSATLILKDPVEHARLYCIIDGPDGEALMHNFEDVRGSGKKLEGNRSYVVNVELPALWLIPDAYTMHMKLIAQTPTGEQVRIVSERLLLDIKDGTGQMDGKVKARLIPKVKWSFDGN